MFLNNITAVDHAYIDDKGMIIGGAVNPTMFVSGEIDPVENVVVDFSTVKKDIKHIIDAKYSGFDHKLWIIEGYSLYTKSEETNEGRNVRIETPCVIIDAPIDAYKFIKKNGPYPEDFKEQVAARMEIELVEELAIKYPNVNISISLDFDEGFWGNSRMDTPMMPFRYVHGLKDSTSWGCQNIAHGHLSYIAASGSNHLEAEMICQKIAAKLDKTIFIRSENITHVDIDKMVLGYETARGKFEMTILNGTFEFGSVTIIDTETTIEHLVSHIAEEYRDDLKAAGVRLLFVSEGLNKGAVAEI